MSGTEERPSAETSEAAGLPTGAQPSGLPARAGVTGPPSGAAGPPSDAGAGAPGTADLPPSPDPALADAALADDTGTPGADVAPTEATTVAVAGAPDLTGLADDLGALAAAVPGVVQVRARPGFAALASQVVAGAKRLRDDLRAVVGGGDGGATEAGATDPVEPPRASGPGGRSAPVVGLAVSDAELRITLDVAVSDEHAGPTVAREVAAALLAHEALADLPEARVDLRIVSIGR